MKRYRKAFGAASFVVALIFTLAIRGQQAGTGPATRTIAETDCTAKNLGSEIPVNAIGEPVSAVT